MDVALIAPLHCNTNIVAARRGVRGIKFDAIGAYPLIHDVTVETLNDAQQEKMRRKSHTL